jgi:predicted small secreted protein
MYPITVLQTLSVSQKRALIQNGIVVCADLLVKPELLRHAHISQTRMMLVLEEAKKLSVATVGI